MVKALIKFFQHLWESEIDYEFEIEFTIYDVIAGGLILFFALWMILR